MGLSRRRFLSSVAVISTAPLAFRVGQIVYAGEITSFVIPDQAWAVGSSVNVDLLDFVEGDLDGTFGFSMNKPLPQGIALVGSSLVGTPVVSSSEQGFIATLTVVNRSPAPPTNLSVT